MKTLSRSSQVSLALGITIALLDPAFSTAVRAQVIRTKDQRERTVMDRRIAAERTGQEQSEYYNGSQVVPGSVLVKIATPEGVVGTDVLVLADADNSSTTRLGATGITIVRSYTQDTTTLITKLRKLPNVLYAEPNYILRADESVVIPRFEDQWGLQNTGQKIDGIDGTEGITGADIGAVPAWTFSTGSKSIVVGIVDTGVDYTHPDLAANMWSAPADFTVTIEGQTIACAKGSHGFNAITKRCDPMDDNNHGTHVAGIIGANGTGSGSGIMGVNQTTNMMALKFLGNDGVGKTSDAINAIEFAIQVKQRFGAAANVRILNNSWGGGGKSQALLDEINRVAVNDILFVAAAGNNSVDNDASPHYPGNYAAPNIITVAATNNRDLLDQSFSNWGKNSVHLGAPGSRILSTIISSGQSYAFFSGTSMATPFVSGVAALVLSRCAIDTQALKKQILDNVAPNVSLNNVTITGGRLDVNKSLHACVPTSSP